MLHRFYPVKIIYSGIATIVFWSDNTKTIVKRAKGTKDDRYNAFCAALAKKTYGNNHHLKVLIKNAENAKSKRVVSAQEILNRGISPGSIGKTVEKESLDETIPKAIVLGGELKVGDIVRILDGSDLEDYYGRWNADGMSPHVGELHIVERIGISYHGIRLKDVDYVWDERRLEKVGEVTE